MKEAELRDESLAISQQLADHCRSKGRRPVAVRPGLVPGQPDPHLDHPRPADDGAVRRQRRCPERDDHARRRSLRRSLVPPGEHSGKGFNDPLYPVTGRLKPTGD